MNTRFNEARNNESGFTLVELLVVIAIIAILTAIAVPAFLNQRQKANDAAVRSDMKSVVTEVETRLVDEATTTGITVTSSGTTATVSFAGSTPAATTVNLSKGVTVAGSGAAGAAGTVNGYSLTGFHSNGGKYKAVASGLIYNSAAGGFTN